MWILIEDQRIVNAEMITDVVFREQGQHAGTASAYSCGVLIVADSPIVYSYFKSVQAGPLTYKPPVEPADQPPVPSVQTAKAQPGQE